MRRARNADTRLRRMERAAAAGDFEAAVGFAAERLRAGRLRPDDVAISAWLGNSVAQALGVLPLLNMPRWRTSQDHWAAITVFDRTAITTRNATLYLCDMIAYAAGMLPLAANRVDPELVRSMMEGARDMVEAARSWVLEGAGDPGAAHDRWWDFEQDSPSMSFHRAEMSTAANLFDAALEAALFCRKQPRDMKVSLERVRTAAYLSHYGAPNGVFSQLAAWGDRHLAEALLAEQWPIVPFQRST